MRHYVLPDHYDGSGRLELSGDEHRYLTRVLRKRPGDTFIGVDSNGNSVSIRIGRAGPGRCLLHISRGSAQSCLSGQPGPPLKLTLFQGIPKANKMDLIIRQAVESGVEKIVPILSEHSVPRFDADGGEKKRERWARIARQAMQQSGRNTAPLVTAPVEIAQLPYIWRMSAGPEDVCLFFHEQPVSDTGLHRLLSSGPRSVGICIGPEGGFSQKEVEDLLNCGLQPVYINTNVLRTETAALYAVAAVQTVILEKDSWNIRQ